MGTHKANVTSVENNVRRIGAWPLLESVAREYRVLPREIVGSGRSRNVARARWRLWKILQDTLNLSSVELGVVFERDASTICGGIRANRGLLRPSRRQPTPVAP